MKITRDLHTNYMLKVAPLLALAYVLQSYLYLEFGPEVLAREIIASLGLCLSLLIVAFYVHDRFHEIKLHNNHMEIKFTPLKLHRELLYRNVENVYVKRTCRKFADVVLELRDGSSVKLHHIDDPYHIQKVISDRRTA